MLSDAAEERRRGSRSRAAADSVFKTGSLYGRSSAFASSERRAIVRAITKAGHDRNQAIRNVCRPYVVKFIRRAPALRPVCGQCAARRGHSGTMMEEVSSGEAFDDTASSQRNAGWTAEPTAPLSQWSIFASFDSAHERERARIESVDKAGKPLDNNDVTKDERQAMAVLMRAARMARRSARLSARAPRPSDQWRRRSVQASRSVSSLFRPRTNRCSERQSPPPKVETERIRAAGADLSGYGDFSLVDFELTKRRTRADLADVRRVFSASRTRWRSAVNSLVGSVRF